MAGLLYLTPNAFFSAAATAAGANVTLPVTSGQTTLLLVNMGPSPAVVLLGTASATLPLTQSTGTVLMPGQSIALALGSNTNLAITANGFGNAILNGTIGT